MMHRREFLRGTALVATLARTPSLSGVEAAPQVAFTFDDPTTEGGAGMTWEELNERILSALEKHNTKAVLFVCGKRVDSQTGAELISSWDRAGHRIGNHSYSHLYFNGSSEDGGSSEKVTLAVFETDALKVEPQIRGYGHFVPLFRYPFFKEGNTVEKRD